jgi:hypothetical protein
MGDNLLIQQCRTALQQQLSSVVSLFLGHATSIVINTAARK